MNTLFLLCLTFGIVKADMPLPDELKNHYRLIVNEYNTTGCSSTPFNSPYAVQQCQANGTELPYCCVTMLRSLSFPADENSFNMCLETGNDTSYFATCEQYYTDTQVEYGKIFGYVILGISCFVVLALIMWLIRRCCCNRNEGYGHI